MGGNESEDVEPGRVQWRGPRWCDWGVLGKMQRVKQVLQFSVA